MIIFSCFYVCIISLPFPQVLRIKPPMCITLADAKFAVDVLALAITETLPENN